MVPLTAKLQDGDQVEIITNPNSFGPSRELAQHGQDQQGAQAGIRQFFKNQDKGVSVEAVK